VKNGIADGETHENPCHRKRNTFVAACFLTLALVLSGCGGSGGSPILPGVTLFPSSLSFGNQDIQSVSGAQTVTITNGSSSSVSISGIVAGTGFLASSSCGSSLSAGSMCTVQVTFAPAASGPASSTLTISYDGGSQMVALAGVGTEPLGTVTDLSSGPCTGGLSGTCYQIDVSCPNIAALTGTVKVNSPSGNPIGTVLLATGDGGTAFYESSFTYGSLVISTLNGAGYTTAQVEWNSLPTVVGTGFGFLSGPGGPRALACRWASMAEWTYTTIHLADANAPFCATGNSGGGSGIAYSLGDYGADAIFAMVEITSGPPLARVDYGCLCTQGTQPTNATGCPNAPELSTCYTAGATSQGLIDAAYDAAGMCAPQSTADAMLFLDDSNASPDANLNYPKTNVRFLYGGTDMSEAVPLGLDFATLVKSVHTLACVADAGHRLPDTLDGATQIAGDLMNYCKLQ
jgi:hypothetical protein